MLYVELILLALLLAMALSIVWSTLHTGISPMMSSGKARAAMLSLASEDLRALSDTEKTSPLIDLGSGWGTLVVTLAREYPDRQVIGYELSWFPWLVSVVRKYTLGLRNLTLYRKDFIHSDLSGASILFCYLFPGGMTLLESKLNTEVFTELSIISNTFALPSCKPTKTIKLDDFYRSPVYLYKWPKELASN